MNFEHSYLDDFINNDCINIDLDKFNIPLNETDEFLSQSNFNNELYQIISNNSISTSTTSSTPAASSTTSTSSSSQNFTDLEDSLFDMNAIIKNETPLNYLDYSTNSSPFDLDSIASPALQTQIVQPSRPETPALTQQSSTTTSRNISVSSTSSTSSNSSNTSCQSKKNLDSRLSLQKLGDILNTSSLDETIKIEKFILDIFQNELGFPLGFKTWIRDTNEEFRKYLLNELHIRVVKVYPELTKPLLETVIKRATYSMMQGRLRKERRAANKKRRS